MATSKTSWKHFFLSSLKGNKPLNADNLYVNSRGKNQKGGQINEPIKLITPTMQVTDQARQSLHNTQEFNHLSKRKRKYRKRSSTSTKRKKNKRGKKKPNSTKKKTYRRKKKSIK
jgi:hypothetical protein